MQPMSFAPELVQSCTNVLHSRTPLRTAVARSATLDAPEGSRVLGAVNFSASFCVRAMISSSMSFWRCSSGLIQGTSGPACSPCDAPAAPDTVTGAAAVAPAAVVADEEDEGAAPPPTTVCTADRIPLPLLPTPNAVAAKLSGLAGGPPAAGTLGSWPYVRLLYARRSASVTSHMSPNTSTALRCRPDWRDTPPRPCSAILFVHLRDPAITPNWGTTDAGEPTPRGVRRRSPRGFDYRVLKSAALPLLLLDYLLHKVLL
jgi:hypothetical protein